MKIETLKKVLTYLEVYEKEWIKNNVIVI